MMLLETIFGEVVVLKKKFDKTIVSNYLFSIKVITKAGKITH